MRILKPVCMCVCLILALIAFSRNVEAQALTFHPGQTATFDIVFEGKDAGDISSVAGRLTLTTTPKPDQPNFPTTMIVNSWKKTGPKAFELSIAIPGNSASGNYHFDQIYANFDDNKGAPVQVIYTPGEFPESTITVDNPKNIEKPKIKSLTAH